MQLVAETRNNKTVEQAANDQQTDWTERPIVLTDADAFSRRMLSDIFRFAGARKIVRCQTGDEALTQINNCQDAVLVGVWRLGDNNSEIGPHMIRKVRKSSNRPRVPALLVTQLRKPADIEDARDSGVDAISLQPFAPCHLVDRLKTITARKREFIKTEWFVGPDRRAGREMRGNFKRNEDVNAGLIDETQALKNQAQSIIFDSLRRRDIFSARIGRSLEQFSKSLANVDRRAMETIHLHRAALANLASLPKSDVQTRVSVVTGLEQIAAR